MELTKWLLVPLGFVLNDWCLIVSASPYRAKANVELNSIPTPRNSNKKGRYILFTICCDCPNATPLQENRIRYTVFTIMWRPRCPRSPALAVISDRPPTTPDLFLTDSQPCLTPL